MPWEFFGQEEFRYLASLQPVVPVVQAMLMLKMPGNHPELLRACRACPIPSLWGFSSLNESPKSLVREQPDEGMWQ